MQSLRCGACSYIIDVQFLSDSTEKCPHCGDSSTPRNVITGHTTEWPAERAKRKAAAKAAQEPVPFISAFTTDIPATSPPTLTIVEEVAPSVTVSAPEPEETPPPISPEPTAG